MTSKTILVLAITAAFIAGTITTGTLVFAESHFDDKCTNTLDKNTFRGHVCRSLLDIQDQIDIITTGLIDADTLDGFDSNDFSLSSDLDAEEITRITSDQVLQDQIDAIQSGDENSIEKIIHNLEFKTMTSEDITNQFVVEKTTHSVLFFGDKICKINIDQNHTERSLLLLFGTETIVEHLGDCESSPDRRIYLDTEQDEIFQPGDILVLRLSNPHYEVYRQ